MLEIWLDLTSLYFVKSLTNGTEYILPPFYAGQSITVRLHTLTPTFNPAAPYTEVASTSVYGSLTGGFAGIAVNFNLVPVGGQLYTQGTLTIPSNTNLIAAGQSFADIFFGLRIAYNGDTIFQQTNATVKAPSMTMNTAETTFTYALTAGQEDGLVLDYSSMGLSSPPTYIYIPNAVQKTAPDQVNLFASVILPTIGTNNCNCELSGVCDITGRSFNWIVQP